MLTGEQRINKGKAFSLGFNLKWNTRSSYHVVSYCPQIDGLFDNLTVRQTLKFFSLLRGIPYSHSVDLSNKLDLSQYFRQKVSQISGGTKRLLSLAIALIGNSPIIYLDEPTASVDMKIKRNVWNILNKRREQGTSILLASDCIEEYQALCNRLVITTHSGMSGLERRPVKYELQIKVEIVPDERF